MIINKIQELTVDEFRDKVSKNQLSYEEVLKFVGLIAIMNEDDNASDYLVCESDISAESDEWLALLENVGCACGKYTDLDGINTTSISKWNESLFINTLDTDRLTDAEITKYIVINCASGGKNCTYSNFEELLQGLRVIYKDGYSYTKLRDRLKTAVLRYALQ